MPMGATGRSVASILTMARSVRVSIPYTSPVNSRPSFRMTLQLGCLGDDMAVRQDPAVGVVDEAGAGAIGGAEQAARRDWMVTTAGVTLSTASMTALDSSMRTSLTLLVSDELATSPVAVDRGWTRFETATAERRAGEDTRHHGDGDEGRRRQPRRGGGGLLTLAGRLVQAGAACQSGLRVSVVGSGP